MMSVLLGTMADWVDGRLVGEDVRFSGVSTDSRTIRAGELFVALRGPSFDGHDYLASARARGAAGALVEPGARAAMPLVEVSDTLLGLGRLASQWRTGRGARVIGLTGSNGKTTLKEMLAAILACKGSVLATRGNLNNAIGVPLTLCRMAEEQFAVIEMGANHAGEIDYLSRLVKPDIAILNNAGRAHLEGFGSLEGVARAKAEIINGLGANGVFVFNADDRFAPLWRELAEGHRQRTFGVTQVADVYSPASAYRVEWCGSRFAAHFTVCCEQGECEVGLQLAGEHNRMNALAAIAASLEAGASLDDAVTGLLELPPVPGRLYPTPGVNGARLIDDSYNANPDSVIAALRVLAAAPGRRTLVLGDLAELGEQSKQLHRDLGEIAAANNVDRLMSCGSLSRETADAFAGESRHFESREALIEELHSELGKDDSVLIKGSRSARMDEVVAALRAGGEGC
jgi:UDP-N-acetylmuramoyl-tripeptide--D-alanyl-D-alanine ligase